MAIPTILQQLGQGMNPGVQNNLGQIRNMVNLIKNAGNPQALLNNMIAQNPQMKQAIQYVNDNGGNPKAAFEKLAKEKGIDPDEIQKIIQG